VLLLLACVLFAFRGVRAALRPLGSDFTIYWRTGRAVLEGGDPMTVADFIYLPAFAVAMVPFAALPLPVAAVIWQALSLAALLWAAQKCIALVQREETTPPAWIAWAPLACVLRLADSNLVNGQVNAFIFAAVLASLAAWLQGREVRAGAWIGAAAALKLVPAALFLPIALRGGRRACVAGLLTIAALVFLAPVPFLGWETNTSGLAAWWRAQPGPYLRGGSELLEARAYIPGQSLTAAVYRLLSPTPATARGSAGFRANLLDLQPETVADVVRGAQALYLAVLVATLLRSMRVDRPGARLREAALTITVALTLAPLVHKAHLLWLLLPYTILLADGGRRLARAALRLRWALIVLSLLGIGLTAPAILGRAMATWQLAHNAIFFGMQFLLLAQLVDVWGTRRSVQSGEG